MKFTISSSLLLKKLNTLAGVISSSNSLEILECFLFEVSKETLTISATDLGTLIRTNIAISSDEEGVIAVPSKIITDTLKDLPDQPITLIATKNKDLDEGGSLEIISSVGKYKFTYKNGDDYPSLIKISEEESKKITVQGDVLAKGILSTSFATSNDENRRNITGVFFEFSPMGANFVATDSHKLSKVERTDVISEEDYSFIMQKKPLNLLKNNLLGSESMVDIYYNDNQVKISFDDTEFYCTLIEGKYPEYQKIIPKENPNELLIDRSRFLESVRRVSRFANKSTRLICFDFKPNYLVLTATDTDTGNQANEEIPCEYKGDDDLTMGFDSKTLTEILSNLSCEQVIFKVSTPDKAGLLLPVDDLDEGENALSLLMPIKTNL